VVVEEIVGEIAQTVDNPSHQVRAFAGPGVPRTRREATPIIDMLARKRRGASSP
jgi:hypothetical protein